VSRVTSPPLSVRRLTGSGTRNNLERHAHVVVFFFICGVLHIYNLSGIVALTLASAILFKSAEVCNGQR
jgi:hypothetical protein